MFDNPQAVEPFPRRYGLIENPPISITHSAPEEVRVTIVDEAIAARVSVADLRHAVCTVLRRQPDSANWSDRNVLEEIHELISECDWYRVYEAAEAVAALPGARHSAYQDQVNRAFRELGVGWQFQGGLFVIRSDAAFEAARREASRLLAESRRTTAQAHIDEALRELSRRPDPNTGGSVYHAVGALEALARSLTGQQNLTLGEILTRQPNLFPGALGRSLTGIYGFASDLARHVSEGRTPSFAEAEFVVGLSAQAIVYLERIGRNTGGTP